MKKNKAEEDIVKDIGNEEINENDVEECDCGCDCGCKDDHACNESDCGCEEHHCKCGDKFNEEASYYLSLAQRVQAEFDNYRKRNNEAVKEAEYKGMMKAVEKMLPIIDSITNAKLQIKDEEFKKSIDTLYNQTLQILNSINVKKIEAVGKEFNPHLHNAILTEEVEGTEPDIVLEEFQEGFEMDGKVIRYSVVKVSK